MKPEIIKLQRQNTMGLFEESNLIDHIELAHEFSFDGKKKNLAEKNTGKFYTPEVIALPLIEQALKEANLKQTKNGFKIIDPFCGDGRLIKWLLPYLKRYKKNTFEIHIWDYDEAAVSCAFKEIEKIVKRLDLKVKLYSKKVDTFNEFFNNWENYFDLVITNPPWEVVKPDPKDLSHFNVEKKSKYIASLKDFSNRLLRDFPISRPAKSYGGWGVNLARVGTELSIRLLRDKGIAAIVAPTTIFADQNSYELRKWLFHKNNIIDINIYPAELRLFHGVDQPSVSFIAKYLDKQKSLRISNYQSLNNPKSHILKEVRQLLEVTDYVLPISIASNPGHLEILTNLSEFLKLSELGNKKVWVGRELDETNYQSWLSPQGRYRFVKGRDVERFNLTKSSRMFVDEKELKTSIPNSAKYHRIVWRDVARPNQKRRIIATMVPPGYVAGNSLGVLHIQNSNNQENLSAMLGLISSFVFEFQLRAYLATAHVSAGVMRKIRIPNLEDSLVKKISRLVNNRMKGKLSAEYRLEVYVARAYGLNRDQFSEILGAFPKISTNEKDALLNPALWTNR